ncbi:unnamed protein product, partial [Discosporangium mesarthrocarpum]
PDVEGETRTADEKEVVVRVTVDQQTSVAVPLSIMAMEGLFLSLVPGTNVIDLCLGTLDLLSSPGGGVGAGEGSNCIVEGSAILEVFSSRRFIMTRRAGFSFSPSMLAQEGNMGAVAPLSSGVGTRTRVVFVLDPRAIDGYKLSTLHLIKNLPPERFQASVLDLTCEGGGNEDVMEFKHLLEAEGIKLHRICIRLPIEAREQAAVRGMGLRVHLHAVLRDAETWDQAAAANPGLFLAPQGLGDLTTFLSTSASDALVMSNGARDGDAYLLELARLAGVRVRVLNLGALAGGYMSRLYSGATAFIAPSQYVAQSSGVSKHREGRLVEVCLPVIDTSRILSAAVACPVLGKRGGGGVVASQGWSKFTRGAEDRGGEGGEDGRSKSNKEITFVFIGRMSPEKSPGMFLRAMGLLTAEFGPVGGQNKKVRGILVGDGVMRGKMEGLARDLGANVSFVGPVAPRAVPCTLLQSASIAAVVVPSLCLETFGMVAAEAMLLGVPVISFGYGGSAELIRHLENGVLVAGEPTPRALAEAMAMVAGDWGLRERLGARARADAAAALQLDVLVGCHVG